MGRKILSGAVLLLACAVLYGCGGGGGGGGSGSSSANESTVQRVLAKNILFRTSVANAAIKKSDSAYTNSTTQVTADNVVIDTSGNVLTSTNLQDALNNEMAVDLSKLLPGTTWTITNKTSQSFYSGTTGQVTFSTNSTLTVDSGRFAAGGIVSASENFPTCYIPTGPIDYELLSNTIMYLSWNGIMVGLGTYQQDGIITVIAKSKDSIILVGEGGCGGSGVQRISVLTKVQ